MEIIAKSNLKIKALVIILITLLIAGVSTMSFAAEEPIEPKLNSKVYFIGDTYKLPNKDKIRKSYGEEEGCGIISIISRNAKHPIYVTGEGWIDVEQIVSLDKYITLNFEKVEGQKGLNVKLNVDGEFLDIQSDNQAILDYQDGMLSVKGNGTTDVVITKKDGTEINALATVVDGELALNIPQKAIGGNLSATANIAEKVTIEANGEGAVGLVIDDNGVSVAGVASGDITATTVDGKEIVKADGTAEGLVTVNKDGVTANMNAEQNMTFLQKLTLKLRERANLAVNKEKAEIGAGGDVFVNEKEIASGDVSAEYKYTEADPTVSLRAEILDKPVANVENKPVPVFTALRSLIARLGAR